MRRDHAIVDAAEDLADMARRIRGNADEPHYCGEKAFRAARAAVQILARAEVATEDRGETGRHGERFAEIVERLRQEWDDNIRWARHERAEAR